MAKLLLVGSRCTVKIYFPGDYPDEDLDELWVAECLVHGLIIHGPVDGYDTLYKAAERAAEHCDG